jgi:hypothetical protein
MKQSVAFNVIAFSALLFCTNIIDALLKDRMKALFGIFFITWPRFLDSIDHVIRV